MKKKGINIYLTNKYLSLPSAKWSHLSLFLFETCFDPSVGLSYFGIMPNCFRNIHPDDIYTAGENFKANENEKYIFCTITYLSKASKNKRKNKNFKLFSV